MPAQSLSCPRPSFAFWMSDAGGFIDGAAQTNERPCQTRFDHSLLDSEVLGDLLQRHSGEAMEDKDISIAARESADRPRQNAALGVFLVELRWRRVHRAVPLSIPIAASTALRRSQMTWSATSGGSGMSGLMPERSAPEP